MAKVGQTISESDVVKYENRIIKPHNSFAYILLNKPCGYVTTLNDEKGRKTVLDLIHINKYIYPVGRLDYNTSGLLILTNDGNLAFTLTHPKKEIKKTYIVTISGSISNKNIKKLRQGVYIDNYFTKQAEVQVLSKNNEISVVKLSIKEGKNRQIRKMMQSLNHKIISLKRISIENLYLNGLNEGEYRKLTNDEVTYLKSL